MDGNSFICLCVWAHVTLLPHTIIKAQAIESSEYITADVRVCPAVAFMSPYAPLLALGPSFLDSLGSINPTRAETW